MNNKYGQTATRLGITLTTAMLLAAPAMATEGMFALGFSTSQRAMGGTGVAYGYEAMSAAVNPANAASVGRQFQLGVDIFSPNRGFIRGGVDNESGSNYFPAPNLSYNHPLANGNVFNISMYGNGGMNTDYAAGALGATSVGIDLSQLFISATYAGTSGDLSWGIAPTLAVQTFKGDGLAGFGVTGVDRDWSYGGGLKAGITYKASPTLTLGLTGQTKMYMSKFDEYATLFEGAGSFDIPASITAGLAWKAQPNLTFLADIQRIFYSGNPAISNSSAIMLPLGSAGGPGFGWSDINVLKLGVEYKANDQMTWRAGYAYSENPVGPEDVYFGVLAPGVVTHHLTVGGTYAFNERNSVDFALEYAPKNTVSGFVPAGPPPAAAPGSIYMSQTSISVGWTHKF